MMTYWQPAWTARRKKRWMKKRPGIDILYKFSRLFVPILNRMVFDRAVLYPASSKIAFTISVVDDLPLVPVTAITFMCREGKRYHNAERKAKKLWYAG